MPLPGAACGWHLSSRPSIAWNPEAAHLQGTASLSARRVVLLGPAAPFCIQFPSVQVDDLLAGYAAAQHLVKLGHKRIAFLAGPLAAPWSHLVAL